MKTRIIKKQYDEIQSLKNSISELEIDAKEKEKITKSIAVLQDNFLEVLNDLKKQREEYDKLINELMDMKNAMKSDKNFERLINSMTIDQIVGKSSLAKGKSLR